MFFPKFGGPKIKASYEEGILQGKYQLFYPNGNLKLQANFKDGILDGKYKIQDSEGNKIQSGKFDSGKYIHDDYLTDDRNGKKYAVTKINGLVWMAENLDYASDSSYCYDDDPANCLRYGRLYTWDEATKVCPEGWRLPAENELSELQNIFPLEDGMHLKAANTWEKSKRGFDVFGLSLLPSGFRSPTGHAMRSSGYFGKGTNALIWSSKRQIYLNVSIFFEHGVVQIESAPSQNALSVRCVKRN